MVMMVASVYDATGITTVRRVRAVPECGEDFCEDCGDCLYCNGDDPCHAPSDRRHRWVVCDGEDADAATLVRLAEDGEVVG